MYVHVKFNNLGLFFCLNSEKSLSMRQQTLKEDHKKKKTHDKNKNRQTRVDSIMFLEHRHIHLQSDFEINGGDFSSWDRYWLTV